MEKNRAIQIADQIKALDLKQMDKVELVDISLLINIYLIELSKKIDDELIARDVKFYISTFGGKLYQISQNQPKVLDKKINNNQKILKYCLDNGIKEV
jgi:hypothetical protein